MVHGAIRSSSLGDVGGVRFLGGSYRRPLVHDDDPFTGGGEAFVWSDMRGDKLLHSLSGLSNRSLLPESESTYISPKKGRFEQGAVQNAL